MSPPQPDATGFRPSLFRCDHCARVFAASPAEVRRYVRANWPFCCGGDMGLFIEAERPPAAASEVQALPLALPGADPTADTAIVSVPLPRRASNPFREDG